MFNSSAVKNWLAFNERSMNWLARKTGLAKFTILKVVNGQVQPSLETVAAISSVTGLPVQDLILVEQPARNAGELAERHSRRSPQVDGLTA